MKPKAWEQIVDKIRRGKRFLITAHMNLEGDALGSELAVYLLLRKLGKKAVIYNHDRTPVIYKFLPAYRVIKNVLTENNFNAAIVLDCSDLSRTGKVKDRIIKTGSIINIDHHISNTYFGHLNWVEPAASSVAQMLYQLCQKFKIIDRNIALCLYTGIMVDSGNFSYANTNPQTHQIASHLLSYNLKPSKMYENIHSLCNFQDLGFIGQIISDLRIDSSKKICWAAVAGWRDKNYDLTEVIFSIMRLLKDTEVFLLFKSIGRRKTRVNFRSRSKVDVNKIAKLFGGGGHKRASGATLEENLEQAEQKVISLLKNYTDDKR